MGSRNSRPTNFWNHSVYRAHSLKAGIGFGTAVLNYFAIFCNAAFCKAAQSR